MITKHLSLLLAPFGTSNSNQNAVSSKMKTEHSHSTFAVVLNSYQNAVSTKY